jgi:hypothetical protein
MRELSNAIQNTLEKEDFIVRIHIFKKRLSTLDARLLMVIRVKKTMVSKGYIGTVLLPSLCYCLVVLTSFSLTKG